MGETEKGGIRMIGYFIFDDIDTRDYQGIVVSENKVDSAPERVYEVVTVAGRNGTLLIDTQRYENAIHSYDIIVHEDYVEELTRLRNDLMSKVGYKTLTDGFNPEEKYFAALTDSFDPQQKTWRRTAGSIYVAFTRKPQRFLLSGEEAQTFSSSGTITNPTQFEAKPLLVVTGAGQLVLGSYVVEISNGSGANQVIYIDCDSQEAWEMVGGAMVARNDYIQIAGREFPTLEAGENIITLSSGITKVEITPRWWRI